MISLGPEQARSIDGEPPPATTVAQLIRRVPRAADQARAYSLAPGLWSLVLPLPYAGLRSVNGYLLETDDGLCLVDCGSALAPGWDGLAYALELSGHQPAEINLLVCTHLHQDHAGLAATVAGRVGCQLARPAGPEVGHDTLRDRMIPLSHRRERAVREGIPAACLEMLVGPLIAGDGDYQRPRFDRVMEAGQTLNTPSGTWEVVSCPGHAAAQLALWEAGRGWMICADLLSDGEVPMLQHGGLEDPLAAHVASLEGVLALGPSRLLPGHGRPIEPHAAVRRALGSALDSTVALRDRALVALRPGPLTAFEFSLQLDPDNPDLEWRQTAMSSALCALEHLLIAGEAHDRLDGEGRRRFALGPVPTLASRRAGVEPD